MDKKNLSLDWLSFSWVPSVARRNGWVHESDDLYSEFMRVFPELDSDEIKQNMFLSDKGSRLYQNFLIFGDSWGIRYDDSVFSNKGVNVEIHPAGLRFWFELLNVEYGNIKELLKCIFSRGCKISRIDLCYDDYERVFSPSWYMKKATNGFLNTRLQTWSYIGDVCGDGTFYMPSPTQKTRSKLLRIYDKNAESDGEKNCIRYEFSLNHGYADRLCHDLVDLDQFSFVGLMKGYFTVLEYIKYGDKSRSPICKEWDLWLQKLEFCEEKIVKIKKYPALKDSPIGEKLSRQRAMYGRMISKRFKLLGRERFMKELLEDVERLTPSDHYDIQVYRHYDSFESIWMDISDNIELPFGDLDVLPLPDYIKTLREV